MMASRTYELRYLNSYFEGENERSSGPGLWRGPKQSVAGSGEAPQSGGEQGMERSPGRILVVYGEKNVGKTTLLGHFAEGKKGFFYRARSASEREQRCQWARELKMGKGRETVYPTYGEIFQAALGEPQAEPGETPAAYPAEKKYLIVDEFQYVVRAGEEFMRELLAFLHDGRRRSQVLVILCSSSIGWVENSMVNRMGEAAAEISGFLKVRELGFEHVREFFPDFSRRQCVETYAILGGVPGFWSHFDGRLSTKDNICRHILDRKAFLYGEGQRIVAEELREMSVYNTILAAIASGRRKLNDLYLHTEFSRAKISVYLKNLMELELVEKVFSYDTEGKANTQKGVYRISNHFVHFYFTYLYPNLGSLERMDAEEFYKEYIAPTLNLYVANYFSLVCKQRFERWNKEGKLPFRVEKTGEWVGKFGTIDIVAQNEEGKTILGVCNWEKPVMRYDDYEWFLFCAEKARLTADYMYLFSVHDFEERLKLEARVKPNMKLISMDEM